MDRLTEPGLGAEEDKALVRQFFAAVNENDFDTVATLVRDDITWRLGVIGRDLKRGRAEVIDGFLKSVREQDFVPKDPKFELVNIWWDDSWVFAEVRARGRLLAGGEYYNEYFFVMQVVGAQIGRVLEYLDSSVIGF